MKTALKHPEHFILSGSHGEPVWGCNQDWYPRNWQRRAGCGPTTATNLLIYHQRAGRIQLRDQLGTTDEALDVMQQLWHHVKPTLRGVHTPGIFQFGLKRLLQEMARELDDAQIQLEPVSLLIPRQARLRPTLAQVTDFIAEGLAQDSPVAFLNLHNGSLKKLDRWHWVTLTSLDVRANTAEAEVCDNTNRFAIDLQAWYETTLLGGGFVYLRTRPG